ncbi:MAG: FAD-binding oxidoreductase [Pseudomonadota bacterium]
MDRRNFLRSSVAATLAASTPAWADWEDVLYLPTKIDGDIDAVKLDGSDFTLKQAEVQELSNALKGKLWLPGSAEYDEARTLLEPSFDKRPAFVIQPSGPADVSSAVRFARDNDLLTAVKCGGHSASGKSSCNGGMQIDLSRMRGVYVDPIAKTARVEGGSLLGELDHEAMAHGLVTTAGTVSHTGVGGLTLGGGFGRLARRFGLSLDNVLEFDVVTADGELRRASLEHNPNLYWALRGGGGNFGVVTSLLFQLHPMQREMITGSIVFPFDQARQVLSYFGEFADAAPDDMHIGMFMGGGPDDSPAGVGMYFDYSGTDTAYIDQLTSEAEKVGTVLANTTSSMDYVAVQRSGDYNDIRSFSGYMKTGFVGDFDGALIDDLLDGFEPAPGRRTSLVTQQAGGAIGRVANDATAFAHREAKHNLLSFVSWKHGEDGKAHKDYIRGHWDSVKHHSQGFYSNDLYDQEGDDVSFAYRGNFRRLQKIKKEVDPTNLFRLNANIQSA